MAVIESAGPKASVRDVRYPKVNLRDAVAMMKEVGVHGRHHQKSTLASYLGHDTPNSGAFMTKMGALRDWGFITGRGDDISITDAGYLVAHESDDQAVAAAVRTAFLQARVFGELYAATAKNVNVRSSDLASRAVLEFRVSPAAKKSFLKVFLDSAEYARLARVEGETVIFMEGSPESPEPEQESGQTLREKPETREEVSGGEQNKAVLLRQVWPGANTDVVLEVRSNRPLEARAFALLGEIVQSINKLVETLPAPAKSSESDDADLPAT